MEDLRFTGSCISTGTSMERLPLMIFSLGEKATIEADIKAGEF